MTISSKGFSERAKRKLKSTDTRINREKTPEEKAKDLKHLAEKYNASNPDSPAGRPVMHPVEQERILALNSTKATPIGLPPMNLAKAPVHQDFDKVDLSNPNINDSQATTRALKNSVSPELFARTYVDGRSGAKHRQNIDSSCTEAEWNAVKEAYKNTGSVHAIADTTKIPRTKVDHLINFGITRLQLPAVRGYYVDMDAVNRDVAKIPDDTPILREKDVETTLAVQQRATQEAATAKNLLRQVANSGAIIGGYVNQLLKGIFSGNIEFMTPSVVLPETLETLAKIMDAHTRAMERALKLSLLTQGEPTDRIEYQVHGLLAACTTEELEQAAAKGVLPRRLTARIGSLSEDGSIKPTQIGSVDGSQIIDIQPTDIDELPQWEAEIEAQGPPPNQDDDNGNQ